MKTAIALLATAVVAATVASLVTLKAAPRGASPLSLQVLPAARVDRPGEKGRTFAVPPPRLAMPAPEAAGGGDATRFEDFNQAALPADNVRVLQALEGTVEREQRDPAWAPGFEQQIRKGLQAGLPGERIADVSCRSTLCRVELDHSAPLAREDFINKATDVLPPGLVMHLQKIDREGHSLTVIHLIRAGYQPPPLL
jgi:hypothetical protein